MMDGDLSQGVSYGYVLDDCYHSRDIVGSGFLCFTWRRRTDTYTASDCRDCNSISTVDWKTHLEWRKKIAFTDRIAPSNNSRAMTLIYFVLLWHFLHIPYMSKRCPVRANSALAVTLAIIS